MGQGVMGQGGGGSGQDGSGWDGSGWDGEQNSNVEIPYQVIDNHVVFNIPGGSDNLENIMYPIENLDNVVEREINLNDM